MRQGSCTQGVHSSESSRMLPGNSTLQHSHVCPITHPPWITSPPRSVLSPQLILPLLTSLQALSTLTQSTHCADWSSPSHTAPSTCQNPNVSGGVLPFHPPEKALFTKKRVAAMFRPSQCNLQTLLPSPLFTRTSVHSPYTWYSHTGL